MTRRLNGPMVDDPVQVFGFDPGYVARDKTLRIVQRAQVAGAAMIRAEAAAALAVRRNRSR